MDAMDKRTHGRVVREASTLVAAELGQHEFEVAP
jgi:hypothetical protein